MRVLVVEDEAVSARLIRQAIEPERFLVEQATIGEEAVGLAKLYDFDIAIVDLKLPDMDGTEVVRRMRLANVATPVLMLSGSSSQDDRIRALMAGADDFLEKPFDRRELAVRLQAIVRRSRGHAASVIRTGRLTVDLNARSVEIDGKKLPVTPKEYGILELLSLRKGKLLTKEIFLDHLYGGMDEPEQKIVDVFICKLRKKIATLTGEDVGIQTVWGQGYMLKDVPAGHQLAEEAAPFMAEGAAAADPRQAAAAELDLLLLHLLPPLRQAA
ncbi:response regulator transcription factor [Marinivivus vitaminiproducens]|uniref:response regulator transcription factor n=1 Tax=Marinivivus vitaminiproducens TaxID=3035935 RepID=UPI0027A5CB84|nr:response regulator transcription factor [Geminicoccaceae bacterium SCSIO 64248]